jgi:hypothetical protein
MIPVLFWGSGAENGDRPFACASSDRSIVFNADIVAATFFLLSRWEETQPEPRDMHGRFPAAASVAARCGFLDLPIVDQYALILRQWVDRLVPDLIHRSGSFEVRLSHDIDAVSVPQRFGGWMRRMVGDLIKRRDPTLALSDVRQALVQWRHPERVWESCGIERLVQLSTAHGFRSAFYFMATKPASIESDYDVAALPLRHCIAELRKRSFEIGLHAGYNTLGEPLRLAEEKRRLDAITGETALGGRQHYLRFRVPATWRHWEDAHLTYDSTLGYADDEGFRCGTCHAFSPFDVDEDRILRIVEIPLIVMDATLRSYRQLTPQQACDRIELLARRCRDVEGTFTLLWHNQSPDPAWGPSGPLYAEVLQRLSLVRLSSGISV